MKPLAAFASLALILIFSLAYSKDNSTLTHNTALLVYDLPADTTVTRFRSCLGDYQIASSNPTTRQGLDQLRASASGAYTAEFLSFLKESVPTKDILIVDLRGEKHGFLDGRPISWYAPSNFAPEHINLTHSDLMSTLAVGQQTTVTRIVSKHKGVIEQHNKETVTPKSLMTEEQLAHSHGMRYINLVVKDHHIPDDEIVDAFIDLCQNRSDETWVHMHCRAGKGRATTFMVMLDIINNAHHLSLKDIVHRQYLLGKRDLFDLGPAGTAKHKMLAKRAAFLKKFYAYAKDVKGLGSKSWSEWKSAS